MQTVSKFSQQLENDPIVHSHLDSLYDSLLEQNLCRLIEPFSRVQVSFMWEPNSIIRSCSILN